MNIDFSREILGHDGKSINITLGQVCMNALNVTEAGKPPLALSEAVARGNLAIRIGSGGAHDISIEEASTIRKLLPLAWTPIVVARAAAMLDPEPDR